MKRKPMKKVTRLALALTAALGIAVVTNVKPSHASQVQTTPTQRVQQPQQSRPASAKTLMTSRHQQNPVNQNRVNRPRTNQPKVSRLNRNPQMVRTQVQSQGRVQSQSQQMQVGSKRRHKSLVGTYDLIRGHHFSLPQGKAGVAMDARTGQIVWAKHPNQKRLVASTSKLMTLYLAEKKLAKHPKAWNHKVHVSRALINMGNNPEFDAFRFKAHKRYRISDLFKATVIASDDNAAIRLGEWVGGTNRHFIHMMNKQARKWHLRARFTSSSGLENNDLAPYGFWVKGGYYSGNMVSAKSLAIIAYHLLKKYPSILKYASMNSDVVDGQKLTNANRILPGRGWYRASLHTDGLKTGYTPRAGLCLVGTGKLPGKDRLITVVLDDSGEFGETDDLMNFVYKYSNLYNN